MCSVPEDLVPGVPGWGRVLLDTLETAVGEDLHGLDDDVVLGLFDVLETVDRLSHALRFGVLAELDVRRLTDTRFGHVVSNAAGWRHGADPRRVRRDLKCAKTLRRALPDVAAALAEGTISVDRAKVLAAAVNERNTGHLTETQTQLLDIASQEGTFAGFCRDVDQVARYADPDGVEPVPPRDTATLIRHGDQLTATIDLFGIGAIGFAQRLEPETDRLYRAWSADRDKSSDIVIPARSQLLAQAFANLVETGAAHRNTGRIGPTADISIVLDVDPTTVAGLFNDGTLLPGPGLGPVDWSERAVDLLGTPLRFASRDWELLTCDATIEWVLREAGAHPVAAQTGERHANRAQRRALALRDGGCAFPGCDAPPNWCDAHHVIHHANGGPSEIRNLVLCCRRHHGVIHRRGWTLTANTNPGPGDGYFTITTPHGHTLQTQHTRGPTHRQQIPA